MAEPQEAAAAEVTISGTNPFPGLRAFNPKEHYLYFGRADQTNELMSRLRSTRFLSVVGTSGSGKSSLVLAGLVPALHSGFMAAAGSSWRVAIMRPGGDPIGNLAAALASPKVIGEKDEDPEIARSMIEAALRGSSRGLQQSVAVAAIPKRDNVLLVVDQFEELFRFKRSTESGASREAAMAFVKLLLEAGDQPGRLYVVITMRSDFIGDCMEFPGLPEAINEGQYLVPRMTRDELRQAITGPVGVAGGKISPRLVSRLLNEVGDQLDQLPVMQHALMRLWGHWESTGQEGKIDLEHYKAIGTMRNALSIHAEKAFQELSEGREREIAERIFKTLTEKEGEGRGVRRPARLSELCEIAAATQEEVVRVILGFRIPGRSFLVPPSSQELTADSIVDISHESLMRNWKRLAEWTEEEAASARVYRRLSASAAHHEAGEEGLWDSPELDLGLAWREENQPTAAWARRYDPDFERAIAFLDKSEEARRLAERKRRRGKRLVVGIAGLILLLTAIVYNVVQEQKHLTAVTVALSEDDPMIKALVLPEVPDRLGERLARLFGRPTGATGGLEFEALRRVAYEPIPTARFRDPQHSKFTSAAVSGEWVVTGSASGEVRLWRSDGSGNATGFAAPERVMKKGQEAGTAHRGDVTSVSFLGSSGAERRVLTSSVDGSARIWSLQGELERNLAGHKKAVTGAAVSAAGDRIVTASRDGTAIVWKPDGERLLRYSEHTGEVSSAAFYPCPQNDRSCRRADWILTLSTAEGIGEARIWSAVSGETLWRTFEEGLRGAWFIPRSGKVLTIVKDSARIFELDRATDSDEPRAVGLQTTVDVDNLHLKAIQGAAISRDGTWVLTFAHDRTATLWKPDSHKIRVPLSSRETVVANVANASFGPDNKSLAIVYADGTVSLWSLAKNLWTVRGHVGRVVAAAFDETGQRFLTAGEDGTARIWPLGAGEPRMLGRHDNFMAVTGMDFRSARAGENGDSMLLVTSSYDGTAQIWPLGAGEDATEALLVTASHDGTRLWRDRETGDLRETREEPAPDRRSRRSGSKPPMRPMMGVALSRDADRIVTSSADETARLWELEGEPLQGMKPVELKPHSGTVTGAAFDPLDNRVVTSSLDGRTRIWDVSKPERPEVLPPPEKKGVGKEERGRRRERPSPVTSAAFSPDFAEIVTASLDGIARIWDAAKGELLATCKHDGVPVKSAVFHPRTDQILTASGNLAYLWKLSPEGSRTETRGCSLCCVFPEKVGEGETQYEVAEQPLVFKGNLYPVTGAAFSADGTKILTSAEDGTVRVWSAESPREELYQLRVGKPVRAARFSPDGAMVATGSADGEVQLWRVTEDGLRKYLEQETTACLTVEERCLVLGEFGFNARRRFRQCEEANGRDVRNDSGWWSGWLCP